MFFSLSRYQVETGQTHSKPTGVMQMNHLHVFKPDMCNFSDIYVIQDKTQPDVNESTTERKQNKTMVGNLLAIVDLSEDRKWTPGMWQTKMSFSFEKNMNNVINVQLSSVCQFDLLCVLPGKLNQTEQAQVMENVIYGLNTANQTAWSGLHCVFNAVDVELWVKFRIPLTDAW